MLLMTANSLFSLSEDAVLDPAFPDDIAALPCSLGRELAPGRPDFGHFQGRVFPWGQQISLLSL